MQKRAKATKAKESAAIDLARDGALVGCNRGELVTLLGLRFGLVGAVAVRVAVAGESSARSVLRARAIATLGAERAAQVLEVAA